MSIAMAGYSSNPLIVKLGIKPGMRVHLVRPPANYFELLGELPRDVTIARSARGQFDFIHWFTTDEDKFESAVHKLKTHLAIDGMLWISWPKKSSSIASSLDENMVREFGLAAGLVDVKVCAVDQDWSALKFVFRLKDRKKKG
jgi:hypothetical protein